MYIGHPLGVNLHLPGLFRVISQFCSLGLYARFLDGSGLLPLTAIVAMFIGHSLGVVPVCQLLAAEVSSFFKPFYCSILCPCTGLVHNIVLREAAKKVLFLVVRPLSPLPHDPYFALYFFGVSTMVFILAGNSERAAYAKSNICHLICLKHLIRSTKVTHRMFFSENTFFHHACATCSELPSSTMVSTEIHLHAATSFYSLCSQYLFNKNTVMKERKICNTIFCMDYC